MNKKHPKKYLKYLKLVDKCKAMLCTERFLNVFKNYYMKQKNVSNFYFFKKLAFTIDKNFLSCQNQRM